MEQREPDRSSTPSAPGAAAPRHPRALVSLLCAGLALAAVIVTVAVAVLPVVADPEPSTPAAVSTAPSQADAAALPATPTPTARTGGAGNAIARNGSAARNPTPIPSPTPRTVRRPTAPPAVEPPRTRTPTPTVDLVVNGDFEVADGSWYVEDGAAIATGDAHRGNGLFRIDESGGYAGQRIACEPGRAYEVTAWARLSVEDAEQGEIGVTFEDAAYAKLDVDPVKVEVSSGKWRRLRFSFTPPAGAAHVVIYFWKPSGRAELLVDEITVRPVAG